jgi:hypothetical protein
VVAAALAGPAHAAHPLITEDTLTQGRGNFQAELNTEHLTVASQGLRREVVLTNAVLTYGVRDPLDVLLTVPHLRLGASAADGTPGRDGLADVSLDLKWRFYERGPVSAALIPGVRVPTGDDTRGLGTGRLNANAFLVTSYRLDTWMLHLHVGYTHHANTRDERVHIWHASTAAEYRPVETLRLIVDTGIDTNTDRGADSDPAFLITGLIWSAHTDLDLDLGVRWESSDVARGRALLAGLTWRW